MNLMSYAVGSRKKRRQASQDLAKVACTCTLRKKFVMHGGLQTYTMYKAYRLKEGMQYRCEKNSQELGNSKHIIRKLSKVQVREVKHVETFENRQHRLSVIGI